MDQQSRGALGGGEAADAPAGLLLCDSTGRILRVNRVLCDIVGRSETALVGLRHAELLHPADRTAEDADLAELMTGASTRYRVVVRYLRPDGEVRWAAVTASLLRPDRPSAPPGHPLVVRRVVDTTDQRRIEAERDRFFHHSPAGIMLFGFDGRFKRVNRAVTEMLGWSEDELVGRHLLDLAHPDEQDLAQETATRLITGCTPITYESRVRTRTGEYRWLRSTATRASDEGLVYCWSIDIHEQKQAEALLRESEDQFRRLFEESPAGGVLIDPLLRLQKANAALTGLLDRSGRSLEGLDLAEIVHPDDLGTVSRLTRRTVTGTIPGYDVEARLLHQNGSAVWVAIKASLVHDGSGRGRYVLQIIEDIREVKEAETARRDIDQLKDGFLRAVSHDLQNPLLAICHLANLAAREQCRVDLHHDAVFRIAAQATRLQQMVTRLLDLERLYHGNVTVHRRATDISALATRVVQEYESPNHAVSFEVAPFAAAVDPEQMEIILENVLDNAVRHTPPGTPIWVRIREGSGLLDLTIEDAGPGVPDELKDRIFELFGRGDGAVGRTGVGLWIVGRYAELHGGRAWVEDRAGGGASFRVVLPLVSDEPDPGSSSAAEAAGHRDRFPVESSGLIAITE